MKFLTNLKYTYLSAIDRLKGKKKNIVVDIDGTSYNDLEEYQIQRSMKYAKTLDKSRTISQLKKISLFARIMNNIENNPQAETKLLEKRLYESPGCFMDISITKPFMGEEPSPEPYGTLREKTTYIKTAKGSIKEVIQRYQILEKYSRAA